MRSPSIYAVLTVLLLASLTHAVEDPALSLFDALDINHDRSLDKAEYEQGLVKLRDFFRSSPGQSSSSSFLNLKGFWNAFTSAVAMIIATEIGDKTFFIAAVLSMKHDRSAVFGGAFLALIVMTVLSTAMGLVLPSIMPRQYTHILAGFLFLYFGVKLFMESQSMQAGKTSDELEEVEEELLQQGRKKEDTDEEAAYDEKIAAAAKKRWYQVALQALSLTFLAEWGDRSQIATIALAAAKNPLGVTIGGCLGHGLCTGLAVLGGRMLAARISEKTVHQYGGVIFLLFGLHSIFFEQ